MGALTAVDGQHDASDERGIVGREEHAAYATSLEVPW